MVFFPKRPETAPKSLKSKEILDGVL